MSHVLKIFEKLISNQINVFVEQRSAHCIQQAILYTRMWKYFHWQRTQFRSHGHGFDKNVKLSSFVKLVCYECL